MQLVWQQTLLTSHDLLPRAVTLSPLLCLCCRPRLFSVRSPAAGAEAATGEPRAQHQQAARPSATMTGRKGTTATQVPPGRGQQRAGGASAQRLHPRCHHHHQQQQAHRQGWISMPGLPWTALPRPMTTTHLPWQARRLQVCVADDSCAVTGGIVWPSAVWHACSAAAAVAVAGACAAARQRQAPS